jgi:hypothetical protein
MTTTPERVVLPASMYDALELSALAFGGIGQPAVFDDDHCPVCIYGHAAFVANDKNAAVGDFDYSNPIVRALNTAGIRGSVESDQAVRDINRRLGRPLTDRVPFSLWCAELGVVRGDS